MAAPEIKVAKWNSRCLRCESDILSGQEIIVYPYGRTTHSKCKAATFSVHSGKDFETGIIEITKHSETAIRMARRYARIKVGHEFSVFNEASKKLVATCVASHDEIVTVSEACIYTQLNWKKKV